jgi:hypothetical protein
VWTEPDREGIASLSSDDCDLEDLGGGLFRLALPVEPRECRVVIRRS